MEVQCLVAVATVAIDNSTGCQLYLPASAAAADTRVVTSKSSAVNVLMPPRPGDDPVEAAVPEQFVTVYRGGKWVTEPADHKAG